MTITPAQLALYAGALLVLFMTPGPVWVAILARGLTGGFRAAWPLALGVVVGDVLWPLLAVLGVGWLVATFESFLLVMRWVACAMFLVMGALLLRHADRSIASDSRLTRPGIWAGFLAGVAVIIGNPKAILFYMGILPGFFDMSRLSVPDIAAICAISALVPLLGNLAIAGSMGRVRALMTSPRALRRTNRVAGILLICVGATIPFI